MKNGFKICDTDTHVRPMLETLEPFYDPALRARLPEFEQYRRANESDREGMIPGRHSYAFPENQPFRRILGKAERESSRPPTQYRGKRWASPGAIDFDGDARIRDMDEEGVDCQLLIGFMRAYNRYLNDFCGKYPHRLKAAPPIVQNDIEESVEEIKKWGKKRS